MDYYTLGNTGLKVSRLALGTMTFGDDWGWGADEASARQLFDTYVEGGGLYGIVNRAIASLSPPNLATTPTPATLMQGATVAKISSAPSKGP